MQAKTAVTATFNCSLERAFKSPMLCDVTKIHTGYGIMPRVSHCTEDENWEKIGGSRKVFTVKTPLFKGREAALNTVIDRQENKNWKIEISDFKYWAMGFTKFVGEWFTSANKDGTTEVRYVYTLFSKSVLAYPFHWFIAKTIWRLYLKHALKNIHQLACNKEPYVHE